MSGGRRAVPELLAARAAEQPDRLLVACGPARRTYAQALARSEELAGALAGLGVAPGDRVAVLATNRMEVVDLVLGCARLGAVQVPVNSFLKGEFLRHQLADCTAGTLVVDGPGLETVTPLLADLPHIERILTLDPVPDGVAPALARANMRSFPTYTGENERTNAAAGLPAVPGPDDLASLVYTSGTTGLSKGCMITHGYYVHIGEAWRGACGLTGDDVILTAFPLFHLSGQALALMAAMAAGCTVVFEEAFSASAFMARAAEVGATVAMGVGAMAHALLATPPSPADRAHGLRFASFIPLPEARQLEFEERFGVTISAEGYGQTECAPVCFSPLSGERRRSTAGRPAPWLDVRIVDGEDAEVAAGEVGEIVVRPREPDSLFSGYWGRLDATVAAFRNLWHHTGDLGRMDADGYVSFVDRKQDALRRKGENVASMELEAAITRHPKVAEAAVHAVASDHTDDDIKACLVLAGGEDTTPEELFAYFAEQLPYFAVPRYVEIVPALPKNALGRLLKHQLRAQGIGEKTWDFEALGLVVGRDERRAAV